MRAALQVAAARGQLRAPPLGPPMPLQVVGRRVGRAVQAPVVREDRAGEETAVVAREAAVRLVAEAARAAGAGLAQIASALTRALFGNCFQIRLSNLSK
jgi:hypothetical protein